MKILLIVFAAIATCCIVENTNLQAAGMDEVIIQTSAGKKIWSIELASNNQARAKGLMFRKTMAPMSGMLFRFDRTAPVSMWMKNTFIPLDMIFADEGGRITHIHKGAVPESLDVISSQGPVRYVLEINAGEADAQRLSIGLRMLHPWILPPQ